MSTTQTPPDRTTVEPLPRRPRWLVPVVLVGAVALGVALWLFQPWLLFVDEVASEQLPVTVDAAPADAAGSTDGDDGAAGAADTDDADSGDEPVAADADDAADGADGVAEPTGMDAEDRALEEAVEENAQPAPTGPTVLATGSFIGRDHETVGDVALVRLEDGSQVITIEDFRTSNGPDLYVYLDDDPANAEALAFDDGLDLGPLRGNVGDLVYEVPEGADLTGLDTVVIWCDRFSHVFGAADLTFG